MQTPNDITAVFYNLMTMIRRAAIEDCRRAICEQCNRGMALNHVTGFHIVNHDGRIGYTRCDAEKLKGKQ